MMVSKVFIFWLVFGLLLNLLVFNMVGLAHLFRLGVVVGHVWLEVNRVHIELLLGLRDVQFLKIV